MGLTPGTTLHWNVTKYGTLIESHDMESVLPRPPDSESV